MGVLIIAIGVIVAVGSLAFQEAIRSVLAALTGTARTPVMTLQQSLVGGSTAVSGSGETLSLYIVFMVIVVMPLCYLLVEAGSGIRKGLQKSFDSAIVLFGILAFVGSGAAILSVGIVAYCVLRKIRVIRGGEDPTAW